MIDAIVIGGGQSGLAATHHLSRRGLTVTLIEAGAEPVGSWPHYYDSLTLFSPAKYSSLPGVPFPGDPDHYPHRDEVIDYLRHYAKTLDADIHLGHRVEAVDHDGQHFTARTDGGATFTAPRLVADSAHPTYRSCPAKTPSPETSCTPVTTGRQPTTPANE